MVYSVLKCTNIQSGEFDSSIISKLSFEQHPLWYQTLGKYIVGGNRNVIYYLLRGVTGELLAFLPVILEKNPSKFIKYRSIHPLGNYYTSNYEPVILSDQVEPYQSVKVLMESALQGDSWDQFLFGPMNPASSRYEELIKALGEMKFQFASYFWFENWFLDVIWHSSTEYFHTLPSKLKNTIKRKKKKIQAAGDYQVSIYTEPRDMGAALDAFERAYASSWKKPEGIPEFIREFTEKAAVEGWSRVGVARLDGVVCAVQIWFVKGGVASIFKLAHDEQFKQFSVGTLLTYEMMSYVIDKDNVSGVDFLIGGDKYKRDWGFQRRSRFGIAIFNRTLKGRLLAFRHIFLPSVKKRFLNLFKSKSSSRLNNRDN